jgi:hypothetical protein
MIALSRPRPASITIFAIVFFADALIACVGGLFAIPARQTYLQTLIPIIPWSPDAVIVWQSAWFSIALIPIGMIWLSAVRFARWLVTIMAVPKLLGLVFLLSRVWDQVGAYTLGGLTTSLLAPFAVVMLFTPASNRWFAQRGAVGDPAIFE